MSEYTPDLVAWLVEHYYDEPADLDMVEYRTDLTRAVAQLAKRYKGAAQLVALVMAGHTEEELAARLGITPRELRSYLGLTYEALARLLNTDD